MGRLRSESTFISGCSASSFCHLPVIIFTVSAIKRESSPPRTTRLYVLSASGLIKAIMGLFRLFCFTLARVMHAAGAFGLAGSAEFILMSHAVYGV